MRYVCALAMTVLLVCRLTTEAKEVNGFDCWKLGMSRAEVKFCTLPNLERSWRLGVLA